MKIKQNPARGLLATLTVAVVALAALASPALAAPGNINPAEQGSIIVNKFVQPNGAPANLPANGAAITPPTDWVAVEGAQFTVQQLNFNLATSRGWSDLEANRANILAGQTTGFTSGEARIQSTGATGVATFGSLPVAAYLVTETGTTGTPVGGVESTIIRNVDPFIVTVPTSDPAGSGWLYDVNVYPKNSFGAIAKNVNTPTTFGLGSTVSWPISVTVPEIANNEQFTEFVLSDPLDSRLSCDGFTVVFHPRSGGESTFDQNSPEVQGNYTCSGQTFSLDMLASFGTILHDDAEYQGTLATVTVNTTIGAVTGSSGTQPGQIPNGATVTTTVQNPTTGSSDQSTLTSVANPISYWGNAVIRKQGQDNETPLEGAEFQVFPMDQTPGATTCSAGTVPISVGGESTFLSVGDGSVTINGLYVSDTHVNGTAASTRQYCLVETKAPAGYQLPQDPGTVITVHVGNTAANTFDATISNTKIPVGALPTTGAAGRVILIVLGAGAILAASGWAIRLNAKKRSAR